MHWSEREKERLEEQAFFSERVASQRHTCSSWQHTPHTHTQRTEHRETRAAIFFSSRTLCDVTVKEKWVAPQHVVSGKKRSKKIGREAKVGKNQRGLATTQWLEDWSRGCYASLTSSGSFSGHKLPVWLVTRPPPPPATMMMTTTRGNKYVYTQSVVTGNHRTGKKKESQREKRLGVKIYEPQKKCTKIVPLSFALFVCWYLVVRHSSWMW